MAMKKPPFTALNMQELSRKACKGIYTPVTKTFSETLRDLIKKMLKVAPKDRLSSSDIIEMPELETQMTDTCKNLDPESKNDGLLGTIKMPYKMQELNKRLPRPKYSRGGLKRMNSEPSRLPSVHSRSRAGSASSRNNWEVEKPETNRFVPKSVVHSKNKQADFHLVKQRSQGGYFRRDSLERKALQRAASNLVSRGQRRSIDIHRRSDSNNSRKYEEQKSIIQASVEKRQIGMPPINTKLQPGIKNYQSNKPPLGMMRPPLRNMNLNSNNNGGGFANAKPPQPQKGNYQLAGFAISNPRNNSPGLFRFQ